MLGLGMIEHCFFTIFIFAAIISQVQSVSTITRTVAVEENVPSGTIVARLSEYVGSEPLFKATKNFQMLEQKLMPSTNPKRRRRQWLNLNEVTGSVSLRRQLDRENICGDAINCFIRAKIYVAQSSRMIILNVEIIDVNEHAPVFPVNYIIINVSESSPVGYVINLDKYMAHDDDAGGNSPITYSLNPVDDFSLIQYKDETGSSHLQLEVRALLDYERKSFYRFTLFASDTKPPVSPSHISLQVRILDENDNSPIFSQQEYSAVVLESEEAGCSVTRVQAYDADSGSFGSIQYFLADQNKDVVFSLINVNHDTGEITLKNSLDREAFDTFNVLIEAKDHGNPPNIGRTRLVIYIADVNDNTPIINVRFIAVALNDTVYVSEAATTNEYFAYISAKDNDLDSNGRVTMNLKASVVRSPKLQQDASEKFYLTSEGFLGFKEPLDAELDHRYIINVTACDDAIKQRCSHRLINLIVLDENDHTPMFPTAIYNISLSESTVIGTRFAELQATDGDATNSSSFQKYNNKIRPSTNGKISYSIKGGNGTFAINPRSGAIKLIRPLDREQVSKWKLIVTATDGGIPTRKKTQCQLVVRVIDVNDNAPVFTNPIRDRETLYATVLRDDVITRVQAIDYDTKKNSKVKYSLMTVDGIKQNDFVNSSLFILDAHSGSLRLNKSNPNLCSSLGKHALLLQASDSGSPALKSQRMLYVIITDDWKLPSPSHQSFNLMEFPYALIWIIGGLSVILVLLIVIVIAVIVKCKKENRKVRTYKCYKKPDDELANSTMNRSIRCPSSLSNSTNTWSRNDMMMNHNFGSKESKDISTSSRAGSLACKTGDSFKGTTTRIIPHDGDSGHGDSDPDVTSRDISFNRSAYTRQRLMSEMSSTDEPSRDNTLGRNCSQQCLMYGHSDTCWMPSKPGSPTRNPSRGTNDIGCSLSFSLSSDTTELSPMIDGQDHSSNLETIPEYQAMPVYWPNKSGPGSDISSVYTRLPFSPYEASSAENMVTSRGVLQLSEDLRKLCSDRIDSVTDSTTTGYVTEPEVV